MEVTIDLKELLICALLIALFVLVIFAIVLVKHAITTVKNLNQITDDATIVTKIAADRSTEVNDVFGDLSTSLHGISRSLDSNQGFLSALINVGKATASAVSYFRSSADRK